MSINSISMPGGHKRAQIAAPGRAAIFCGILPRHEPEAELGPGPGGQDRLGPFALIAAPQAVDVERRAGPAALERRVAGFARQGPHADLLLELPLVERQRRKLLPLVGRERDDVVVKAGNRHPAAASHSAASIWHSATAGLITAPPNVPECRSCFGPVSRSS